MSDIKAQTIQSEAMLEKQFIDQLVAKGYSRAIIPDEDALLVNIRQHFKDLDDNSLKIKMFINQNHSFSVGNFLRADSLKKVFVSNFANLSSLDDKITHLQQQITSYRQLKKALLQQMFV